VAPDHHPFRTEGTKGHPVVTIRYCVKTAKPVIEILSAIDSQIIMQTKQCYKF